jgi:hypothetical protein
MRRIGVALFLGLTALVLIAVSAPTTVAAKPGPGGGGGGGGACECAPLDAPVICDGGKTYTNMCVASCFHATNCVPTGGGGVP